MSFFSVLLFAEGPFGKGETQNMKSLPIDMSGKVSTILVRLRFRPVIDLTVVSLDLWMRFELRRLGTPNSLFC